MKVKKAGLLFSLFLFSVLLRDCSQSEELTCTTGDGSNYRGRSSVTTSGKTCQSWTSQTPHEHSRTPQNYRCSGLEENYCRNPDNEKAPWCYTTDPNTRWEYCNVPKCESTRRLELTCTTGDGSNYRGRSSVSKSGKTCQSWTSQTPHEHSRTPQNYPCSGLEENYCRNPDNEKAPWCYTTDPNTRWEYCNVPVCGDQPRPELTCTTGDGSNYRGRISVSTSGKTCQSWTSQTPHEHSRTPQNYPCSGLEENYCRNPDNEKAPWCYTTDPNTRWEYCHVPKCESTQRLELTCTTGDGSNYRGRISVSKSGKTCQSWTSQTPHEHSRTPQNYRSSGLEENYCRNPDNEKAPWCYTTDPDARWEYCNVPKCESTRRLELTCTTGDGSNYRGRISVSKSGKTCQSWTSQTPHEHSRTPQNYPCSGLEENYCRNPDNEKAPWCYTTDPNTRWEYCNVPKCESTRRLELTCTTGDGSNYRGRSSVSKSGKTCQSWTSQTPHEHSRTPQNYRCSGLEENYCRNPDNEKAPWCYTTDPNTRWEYCNVPKCESTRRPELTCTTGDGSNYRGRISVSKSGKTCQSWTSQTPHEHSRTPQNYRCSGLEENYCRNPDNEKAPWCYTTDPNTRWEYCHVSKCESTRRPELTCTTGDGSNYRGRSSVTTSGKTCQSWTSQTPHEHSRTPQNYPCSGLEENYCRNPDNEKAPWCYTTDPNTRWEYCHVSKCESTRRPELTCTTGDGSNYRGRSSVTTSGKTCQSWTSQTPHEHSRTPQNYPCSGLEENYCRNPDNEKAPWCYTTDPNTRWEYCHVSKCESTRRPELTCTTGDGSNYRGRISVSKSGKTCQSWTSQTPHEHSRTPQNYRCSGLEENYCRNPDNEKAPWCYTTDPNTRWEYCNVPKCESTRRLELTCTTGDGSNYRGRISVSKSGKTCQSWTSQTPHEHSRTPQNYRCSGLEENYCRNPDNEKAPWCYTTDPDARWEYCNVPKCESTRRLDCGVPLIKPKACLWRVVGGCVAEPHSWPWQISIRIGATNNHLCGGTIINDEWVLTAAHCLANSQKPSAYKIFLGIHTKNDYEPSRRESNVYKIVMGPPGTDIALLNLERPAEMNDTIWPPCLPEKDYIVPDGTDCFVTGWGSTKGTGGEGYLKEAGVPIIENEICNRSSFLDGRVKEHEMCAGYIEGGTDTCQGDSGGPLVCKEQNRFVLQGVTSWGIGCGNATKPGVYVRVSKFVDWIEQSMNEN